MIHISDIQKVYFFYFIGLCAGYLGTFDKTNILIVTFPTLLLIKNSGFDFQTAKANFEKQKTINLILSLVNNSLEVARNNGLNTEELKDKVLEIFQTFFNEMGIASILQHSGLGSLCLNMIQNFRL